VALTAEEPEILTLWQRGLLVRETNRLSRQGVPRCLAAVLYHHIPPCAAAAGGNQEASHLSRQILLALTGIKPPALREVSPSAEFTKC
jgi:hypothetical protein